MKMDQKISLSDTVYAQEVDEEMVLLDMASENYFGLDAVASDIWQMLRQGKTLQEVQNGLLDIYDVEPEMLKKDFLNFVEELNRRGLIKIG
ncbi:MAG: PqqD family protein [Deltaproteobacteria bacterium]|nr:PqqD family protein [Deltaproteobacteria bacterium]MBW2658699.1 PqqD family protein [Deltaproteobacteria bacterium]